MERLIKAISLIAFALALCAHAGAASIPSPSPGSATNVAPASSNPVQYVFTPNTTASSSQVNSNFNKTYSDLLNLETFLSGCSYVPGAAVSGVTVTAPITASLGTCAAGTNGGVNLTLALSHGDYDDLANAQTITGVKTFSASPIFNANISVAGIIAQTTIGGYIASFYYEHAGTGAANGKTIPFDSQGTTNLDHIERSAQTLSAAGTFSYTFVTPYASPPQCAAVYQSGAVAAGSTPPITEVATASGVTFYGSANFQVSFLCVGQ